MLPIYGFPSPPETAIDTHLWLSSKHIRQYHLDESIIQSLKKSGRIRSWKPSEYVAIYGQRVEHVTICLSGQYKVLLNSIDGQSHFMRLIKAGEMFGVPSAITGAPFPTDVVCEKKGETLEISRPVLLDLLKREPELSLAVIISLATRVSEMFDFMEADLLPSLRSRVYQRLVRLAQFNGQPDRLGHVELMLSQTEIAESVNASRPRVQQELKRMEREGLLQLGYKRITLLRL
jgi:CRP/FNR family transcriptional regulator